MQRWRLRNSRAQINSRVLLPLEPPVVPGRGCILRMKVATWNVNGIRAREAQVRAWIEQEHPDVICLQEIKAEPTQVPATLCEMEGYWCYWHGGKGYSGVGLHIRKAFAPQHPEFKHPPFNMEHRIATVDLGPITVASVYVPNGGKDYGA